MKVGDMGTHITLPHLGRGILIDIYYHEYLEENLCTVHFGDKVLPTSAYYLEVISESR